MIKHINHQNFQTTPFVAGKHWHLFNVENDDLVVLESTGSEDTVALEFVDYTAGDPFVNTTCSIALEQQSSDRIIYQEGATGSGFFFPDSEPTNQDGTFKRLVHAQVKSAFYNKFNNPLEIFGVDYIDFPLGKTFRDITDFVRVFTIPRNIFGERVIENTVHLMDNSLDDNVEIIDDGYQNLIARTNLFSKVQEVRLFGNSIQSGSSIFDCPSPVLTMPPVPGYSLWYAPESKIFSGSNQTPPAVQGGEVRFWEDLSGNNNNALLHAPKGPQWITTTLNGKRLLRFGDVITSSATGPGTENRSGLLSTSSVALTGGLTVFVVGSFRQPDQGLPESYQTFIGYHNYDYIVRENNQTRQVSGFNGTSNLDVTDPYVMPNDNYQIFAYRFSDALNEQRLWRSGSSVASGAETSGMGVNGKIAIGHREDDGITSHLSGDIAEIVFYPTPLVDSDVDLVNAYLRAKYKV